MCHARRIRHYQCGVYGVFFSLHFVLMYLWFMKVLMIIIRTLVRWTVVRVCCAHIAVCCAEWLLYVGSTHIRPPSCTCCLCSHCSKLSHRFAPNLVLFLFHRRPIELYHMLFYRVTGAKESKRYSRKFPTNNILLHSICVWQSDNGVA